MGNVNSMLTQGNEFVNLSEIVQPDEAVLLGIIIHFFFVETWNSLFIIVYLHG